MAIPSDTPDFFLNGENLGATIGALHELVDWFQISGEFQDDWDVEISYKTLWIWLGKWDSSLGRVRSLESEYVQILAREMLIKLKSNEATVINRFVTQHPKISENQARAIFRELIDGLAKVDQVARACPVCFWIKGGLPEKRMLEEEMRQCALPSTDPDHSDYPHLVERRGNLERILSFQLDLLRPLGIGLS